MPILMKKLNNFKKVQVFKNLDFFVALLLSSFCYNDIVVNFNERKFILSKL